MEPTKEAEVDLTRAKALAELKRPRGPETPMGTEGPEHLVSLKSRKIHTLETAKRDLPDIQKTSVMMDSEQHLREIIEQKNLELKLKNDEIIERDKMIQELKGKIERLEKMHPLKRQDQTPQQLNITARVKDNGSAVPAILPAVKSEVKSLSQNKTLGECCSLQLCPVQEASFDSAKNLRLGESHHDGAGRNSPMTSNVEQPRPQMILDLEQHAKRCSSHLEALESTEVISDEKLYDWTVELEKAMKVWKKYKALERANLAPKCTDMEETLAILSDLSARFIRLLMSSSAMSGGLSSSQDQIEKVELFWTKLLTCIVISESEPQLTVQVDKGKAKKKDHFDLKFRILGAKELVKEVECTETLPVDITTRPEDIVSMVPASVERELRTLQTDGTDIKFSVNAVLKDLDRKGTTFWDNFCRLGSTLCVHLQGVNIPHIKVAVWSLPFNIRTGSTQTGSYRAATQWLSWAQQDHLYELNFGCPKTLPRMEVLHMFEARLSAAVPKRCLTDADRETLLKKIISASSSQTDEVGMGDIVTNGMVHDRSPMKHNFSLMVWLEACANTLQLLDSLWNDGYVMGFRSEKDCIRLFQSLTTGMVGTILLRLSLNTVHGPKAEKPFAGLTAHYKCSSEGRKVLCTTLQIITGPTLARPLYEELASIKVEGYDLSPQTILRCDRTIQSLTDLKRYPLPVQEQKMKNGYTVFQERIGGNTLVSLLKDCTISDEQEEGQRSQYATDGAPQRGSRPRAKEESSPAVKKESSSKGHNSFTTQGGNSEGTLGPPIMTVQDEAGCVSRQEPFLSEDLVGPTFQWSAGQGGDSAVEEEKYPYWMSDEVHQELIEEAREDPVGSEFCGERL